MGEVWKAEHVGLGTLVAVKVIVNDEFGEGNPRRPELVARFFREAKAAMSLRSPHVVQILDHGDVAGVPYMAMELLEGETLEERLESEEKLTPAKTAEVITQIARAIGKAHEAGIVHRDLKPGNVFLVQNEDEEMIKVLDFGIAKDTTNTDPNRKEGVMTRTGSVVGTPCYMSPEQALGNKTIDYRADLWSMAIIAFECLIGRRPFDGDALGELIVQICAKPIPVPSHMGSVPEGFDAWFAKATSREPGGRYQSAKAMADALREALVGDNIRMTHPSMSMLNPAPVDALAKTASQQLTHPGVVSAISRPTRRRRSPALVFLGVVGVLGIAGAGVFVATRGTTAPPPEPIASVAVAPQPPKPGGTAEPVPATTGEPRPDVSPSPTDSASAGPLSSGKPGASARPGGSGRPGITAKPGGSAKAKGGALPGGLGF